MNIILKLIIVQAPKANFIEKKKKKILMINDYMGKKTRKEEIFNDLK